MINPETAYQLKVTLSGIRPPIWRRLLVPSSLSLKDLHDLLQIAMGWTDSHLHQFNTNSAVYGQPDIEFGMHRINENRVRLDEVLRRVKDTMTYDYDFGDGWEHKIVLEKIIEIPDDGAVPSCIAGARACPPEDCGGVWGYAELLEVTSDPSHPEHEEMLEWIAEDFDPERFDIAEVNAIIWQVKWRGLTTRSRGTAKKRRPLS